MINLLDIDSNNKVILTVQADELKELLNLAICYLEKYGTSKTDKIETECRGIVEELETK